MRSKRAEAMAHFLVEEAGFATLFSGEGNEPPVTVRFDAAALDRATLVESMAQWLLAEIKQHGAIPRASAAPKRYVIARFRKVVRLCKGLPPRAFWVRAA